MRPCLTPLPGGNYAVSPQSVLTVASCPQTSYVSGRSSAGARPFFSEQPTAFPGPRSRRLRRVSKTHTDLLRTPVRWSTAVPTHRGRHTRGLLLLNQRERRASSSQKGEAGAAPPGASLTCVGSRSDGPCHCAPGVSFLKAGVCWTLPILVNVSFPYLLAYS